MKNVKKYVRKENNVIKAKIVKKEKYSELEKLAYKLGQINRGLNHDTKVKDSYDRGLKPAERKVKVEKPVI